MRKQLLVITVLLVLLMVSCKTTSVKQNEVAAATTSGEDDALTGNAIVYKSDSLIIQKLSSHVYAHVSFLNTNSFGRVDCNGMIVVNGGEAIVFDTPSNEGSSEALIQYITEKLHCKIRAVIPTHFHEDCVGGLEKFFTYRIPAYASNKTIALLANKNRQFSKPLQGFDDSLALTVGGSPVYARYFGEGHTKDNIVGYFPVDNAVFGGCLIKSIDATKGNLEDANVGAWSATVRQIKKSYPQPKIVIPGHGKWGGADLLDYTINLFE